MQQRGFTLIELIIVIVILGILAVTAAPRFIDLQSDAREAALEGVSAALQGGAQLVYAKAAIAGAQNGDSTVDLTGDANADVSTTNGYPRGSTATLAAGQDAITNWVELNIAADGSADFRFTAADGSGPGDNSFAISPGDTAFNNTDNNRCYVLYTSAAAGASPVIEVFDDGC